jgi:hypothetical protein
MSKVRLLDEDFRVSEINFSTLVDLQRDAEERGFATRWSSIGALRSQVREGSILLQTLLREERGGIVRAYRCLLLFPSFEDGQAGGIATLDIAPERCQSLGRLDRDADVRKALVRVFALALGGISDVAKS